MPKPSVPERIELAPGLVVSRLVTGLWQVADMERDGTPLDRDRAAADLAAYAEAGFDTFDMADHYGSAEEIAGRFNAMLAEGRVRTLPGTRPAIFTKWCPAPGPMTRRRGARRRRSGRSIGCRRQRSTCFSSIGGPSSIRAGSTPCTNWRASRRKG